MGTNYYWQASKEPKCPHCGQDLPKLHIGKSSAGWCFALRIHPDLGINSLKDWEKKWSEGFIFNEYDELIPVYSMLITITNRTWNGRAMTNLELQQNQATRGPNGLLRATSDKYRNAQPGGTTYDLLDYEFS